ncbi:TPA: M24 family metallopeptidase, partial [Streptococcus suis]
REIYDVVLRANKALIEQAKEGVTYREFDAIPREIINAAGYGANFTHGIGHGIGLDIHEYPYFGKSDETIKAGMVLTDEPGIYLDDKYGVRIEDDLLITENGCEVLTLAPKELIVI